MNILITGCAGFIGFHLSKFLLNKTKYKIFGIDNLNSYYDVNLKKNRLKILKKYKRFNFYKFDLINKKKISENFTKNNYSIVINLAAQAGVRYSIENPEDYFNSNLKGFFNLIENCRNNKIKHFIYASSSSVYGDSKDFPLTEKTNTDKPLSFYAATKKSNEIIAYSYSNIFKLKCTGLRFFTVYGPYGRPDMALFKFADAMLKGEKINLFNNGKHVRDFTYIDDVILQIYKLIQNKTKNNILIPHNIYNIGSNNPVSLKKFILLIEKNLKIKANINYHKLQKGDVYKTHSDNTLITNLTKTPIKTDLEYGIEEFFKWFTEYKLKK